MRWGFNWDLGPFEAWDAIGVAASALVASTSSVTATGISVRSPVVPTVETT